jgi:hypothetical protein
MEASYLGHTDHEGVTMSQALTRSKLTFVAVAVAALVAAFAAATAGASSSSFGKTVLTTDGRTSTTLVKSLIVPLPADGAGFGVASLLPPRLRFSFPITSPVSLTAPFAHSGGITFLNVRNGKRATVKSFVIDIPKAELRADVVGVGGGVAIASLSNVNATTLTADVRLNAAAAGVLNGALDTGIFADGLLLGTAKIMPAS